LFKSQIFYVALMASYWWSSCLSLSVLSFSWTVFWYRGGYTASWPWLASALFALCWLATFYYILRCCPLPQMDLLFNFQHW
jgi:hypothetical protein